MMRRGHRLKVVLLSAAILTILVVGLILLRNADQARYAETRASMSDGFGQLRTVEYNGATYREKPAITTLLIAGIDKTDTSADRVSNTYRNGGQADFLMLVAIDHTDKQICQLQIDRDTMTDVVTLGIFGNETGTRNMQICLSHAFGKTPADNARYTIRAVQNLLEGIEIDDYYIVNYTAVPVLNDLLGGVTVHMDYDMTSVHPGWQKGLDITLHGQEAEDFVRSRMTVGAGTNEERMVRQNEFMRKAFSRMSERIKADTSFADTLVKSLREIAETNLTARELTNELSQAVGYEILPVDHPEGEYTIGSDGFVEFHMREGAAVEWVLDHLYTRQ